MLSTWIDLGFDVVTLGTLVWVLRLLRQHRLYIGSLHSDASRPRVTPELIGVWKQKIARLEKGSTLYKAYEQSLRTAGAWDGD